MNSLDATALRTWIRSGTALSKIWLEGFQAGQLEWDKFGLFLINVTMPPIELNLRLRAGTENHADDISEGERVGPFGAAYMAVEIGTGNVQYLFGRDDGPYLIYHHLNTGSVKTALRWSAIPHVATRLASFVAQGFVPMMQLIVTVTMDALRVTVRPANNCQ